MKVNKDRLWSESLRDLINRLDQLVGQEKAILKKYVIKLQEIEAQERMRKRKEERYAKK